MKSTINKIAAGLRDAIAGKIARATVYRVKDGKATPVQRYTQCYGCGGGTLTVKGRCDSCGDRKVVACGQKEI